MNKINDQRMEPSFDAIERIAADGQNILVVLAALELGIFDSFAKSSQTTKELCADLDLNPKKVQPLLETLLSLGYLDFDHLTNRYTPHPKATDFLATTSPNYRGVELRRLVRMIRGWSWLSEVIKRDTPRYIGDLSVRRTPSKTTHSCLAVRGARAARQLLDYVDLKQTRTLLDLGGGQGGFTEVLVESFPNLRVTLFDFPEIIESAKKSLGTPDNRDQIDFIGGDFLKSFPNGPFDAALIANVLHIFEDQCVAKILKNTVDRLNPSGTLMIRDSLVNNDRKGPRSALLFGVHMVVFSENGCLRSIEQMVSLLENAGLTDIQFFRPDENKEGTFLIGKKGQ